MDQSPALESDSIDIATVAAIAVLAYSTASVVHEGLGHGGAALLLGARPTMFNASFFNYDESTVSRAAQRWISAGGSLANLAFALPTLAILPRVRSLRWRYFLWLFAAVNLLTAFGYLLYSGIAGIGDWARVIEGLRLAPVFRAAMIATGGILYFVVTPRLLMPPLDPFLGRDPAHRVRRARALSLLPYFVGGATLVLAGALNPLGWKIVLISAAAASFGGTSLLAWYFTRPRPGPAAPEHPLGIARSVRWILAAVVVLLFFVFVLGPGIGSLQTGTP